MYIYIYIYISISISLSLSLYIYIYIYEALRAFEPRQATCVACLMHVQYAYTCNVIC